MRKAYESTRDGTTVVCLVPARTDTAWFHDYAMKGEIRFIRGRLRFGEQANSAPFPSAIVIFKSIDTDEQQNVGSIEYTASGNLNRFRISRDI